MFQQFEVNGVHVKANDKLKVYVNKKIGGLDKYVSRHSRKSAHAEVYLKESKAKDKNRFTCEVKIHLPKQTIIVNESALNMFAAVDIVETKLKQQLQKYKDQHGNGKMQRHLFGRMRRKPSADI